MCIILSLLTTSFIQARPAVFCRSCAFFDNSMTNTFHGKHLYINKNPLPATIFLCSTTTVVSCGLKWPHGDQSVIFQENHPSCFYDGVVRR